MQKNLSFLVPHRMHADDYQWLVSITFHRLQLSHYGIKSQYLWVHLFVFPTFKCQESVHHALQNVCLVDHSDLFGVNLTSRKLAYFWSCWTRKYRLKNLYCLSMCIHHNVLCRKIYRFWYISWIYADELSDFSFCTPGCIIPKQRSQRLSCTLTPGSMVQKAACTM